MKLRAENGFSLLELMITISIVGILATLMFSSYKSHVLKSRRTDAVQTLLSMQLMQERYRSTNASYGTVAQIGSGTSTDNGLYTLSVSTPSATGYTVTATASGDQANDTENGTSCTPLSITYSNGNDTRTPAACWTN